MYEILKSDQFDRWLRQLPDRAARGRIDLRIRRAEPGNLGDYKGIGGGVHEMRLHLGPGYRIYFAIVGQRMLLLLGGGDKSTQASDIEQAMRLAKGDELD